MYPSNLRRGSIRRRICNHEKKRYRYLHILLRLVYRDNSFRLQLVNKSAYGWHLAKSSGEFEMHSPNAFAACAHGFGCCGASDDGTLSVA
jgi:hypothetical protein